MKDPALTIGNDIVDIYEKEPPLHSRFSERVFTPAEQLRIGSDRAVLWLYWAAKEAAYKAIKRLDPNKKFFPIELEFDHEKSLLHAHGLKFYCRWELGVDYAHVIASSCKKALNSTYLKSWIQRVDEPIASLKKGKLSIASEAVRQLAMTGASAFLGLPKKELRIEKLRHGIPKLVQSGQALNHLLSFTHHGRFAACAFLSEEFWKIKRNPASPACSNT